MATFPLPVPSDPRPAADRVTVVGAGIVGVCCALALARSGWRVDLLDGGPAGGEQSASHGNGGWISPASVVPMATPGLLRRVPGLLADRDGPLVLRPSALPALAGWLWRFVRAGATLPQVQATSAVLAALLHDAPERHARLAEQAGTASLVRRAGLLYAYPDAQAWAADGLAWQLRADAGLVVERLEGESLRHAAPLLSAHLRLALRLPGGAHVTDPGAHTAALHALAVSAGVRSVRARVLGGRFERGRLVGLRLGDPAEADLQAPDPADDRALGPNAQTHSQAQAQAPGTAGHDWPATRVVLAAGFGSHALLRALARAPGGPGLRVPLASERGYHLVLPGQLDWPQPVMPSDGRMAVTLTPQGLRIAGQVELARPGAPADPHRVRVLWRHARRVLSPEGAAALGLDAAALTQDDPPEGARRWMGHRPSTPDGLPVIGPVPGCEGLVLAYGHGHVGLATAPVTGEAVAGWLQGGEAGAAAVLGAQAARACRPARFA